MTEAQSTFVYVTYIRCSAEKLWSSRAVALPGVPGGIRESRDSDSRNILIGGW